ncbi:MAG: ArsR family transcriptional regulator, partial [Exiguobacterium sp.]
IPADHLLNFVETKEATRQSYLEVLDRAKTRVLTASTTAFSPVSSNVEDWMSLSLQKELTMSEADFQRFATKYRALLDEFTRSSSLDEEDKKHFYIMTTAFSIEERLFDRDDV